MQNKDEVTVELPGPIYVNIYAAPGRTLHIETDTVEVIEAVIYAEHPEAMAARASMGESLTVRECDTFVSFEVFVPGEGVEFVAGTRKGSAPSPPVVG